MPQRHRAGRSAPLDTQPARRVHRAAGGASCGAAPAYRVHTPLALHRCPTLHRPTPTALNR